MLTPTPKGKKDPILQTSARKSSEQVHEVPKFFAQILPRFHGLPNFFADQFTQSRAQAVHRDVHSARADSQTLAELRGSGWIQSVAKAIGQSFQQLRLVRIGTFGSESIQRNVENGEGPFHVEGQAGLTGWRGRLRMRMMLFRIIEGERPHATTALRGGVMVVAVTKKVSQTSFQVSAKQSFPRRNVLQEVATQPFRYEVVRQIFRFFGPATPPGPDLTKNGLAIPADEPLQRLCVALAGFDDGAPRSLLKETMRPGRI